MGIGTAFVLSTMGYLSRLESATVILELESMKNRTCHIQALFFIASARAFCYKVISGHDGYPQGADHVVRSEHTIQTYRTDSKENRDGREYPAASAATLHVCPSTRLPARFFWNRGL
jgi:hypothetical protein